MALTITLISLLCIAGFAVWLHGVLKAVKAERYELNNYD